MSYLQNESDETLVLLTLAGEQAAYEVLVTRYQSRVILSAVSVTKNQYLAEDAAQDAFVTAWMKLNTLTEPRKYGAWVCRIAKNCALNMITRYRRFLPLEDVENTSFDADVSQNPAEQYAESEERREVGESVDRLSDRVRQIIRLHYYEGLSVVEIADRMRISAGTVKWQLHEGRKQIRKELCAMDEKYNDTLVQRVMKKVEELKLWQLPNDKSGFEKVYRDVLGEVEELPESTAKQHALADVLMRGWWWLPGKKNDAMLARIAAAAEAGKNEEVTAFIIEQEDFKVPYDARAEFIREKQIPRLEKTGFVNLLGTEWFRLGDLCFKQDCAEEGYAALEEAKKYLAPGTLCHALIPFAKKVNERYLNRSEKISMNHFGLFNTVEEYRVIDGALCYWKEECFSCNDWIESYERNAVRIFRNASLCDSRFFADIPVGGIFTGSDGTTLAFLSDSECVETPAGRFENCKLWEIRQWDRQNHKIVCRSWYKDGVGIVRQEYTKDGMTEIHTLKTYAVRGGAGPMPFAVGNRWEYVSGNAPDKLRQELEITVSFTEEGRVILATCSETERLGYDEHSFADTARQIAAEYITYDEDENEKANAIYDVIERAEALASTPMERAHAKAAASAARRILDTDSTLHPGCPVTGHWNFFNRKFVHRHNGRTELSEYDCQWEFEWKAYCGGAGKALLYNDILGILYDAANAVWSEEWRVGASPVVEYDRFGHHIRTKITCEAGGTQTVRAGTFENCLKLTLDCKGMGGGWSYRGGKKIYWFADGIGIIRTENEICKGKNVVYELTSYTGTGEGYMPFADGFVRRYDGMNLTDGCVGAAEYTYVADEDGDVVIFADRTGICELPPPITQYAFVQNEVNEQELFDRDDWKAGHIRYGINNFHLFLHILGRPSHNRMDANRSVEIHGFYMKMMEQLGKNGEVPPAWYSLYAWSALIRSAALFDCGRKEEGYEMLETAFRYCEKVSGFHDGELLDAGNRELLGGVRYKFNSDVIVLADGTEEPIAEEGRMTFGPEGLAFCLNDRGGWAWFNPVRDEEKFKDYAARAQQLVSEQT